MEAVSASRAQYGEDIYAAACVVSPPARSQIDEELFHPLGAVSL